MSQNDKNIAGIILDLAQYSDRPESASLYKADGITFMESIAKNMAECKASLIVALSFNENPVKSETERLAINFISDDSGKKGEIPALQKAIKQYRKGLLGALITPVTYPRVSRNVYLLMCHVFQENPDRIIIPIYKGRRGYPLTLPGTVLDELLGNTTIQYLDDLLRAHSGLIFEQLVSDPEICREYRRTID
jgi:CTP:molybdopterin cytidylyltransferase MocA